MGLYCKINLESDWGLPNRTPELGLPIDYTEAINVFSDTFMNKLLFSLCHDTRLFFISLLDL